MAAVHGPVPAARADRGVRGGAAVAPRERLLRWPDRIVEDCFLIVVRLRAICTAQAVTQPQQFGLWALTFATANSRPGLSRLVVVDGTALILAILAPD